MADSVILKVEKVSNVANEIRTMNGSVELLSLEEMTTELSAANSEIDTQASLIEQITSALEGKVAGSSENNNIITANIAFNGGVIYYLTTNKTFQSLDTNSSNVEILNGILYTTSTVLMQYTGEYKVSSYLGVNIIVLFSNGDLTIRASGGSDN